MRKRGRRTRSAVSPADTASLEEESAADAPQWKFQPPTRTFVRPRVAPSAADSDSAALLAIRSLLTGRLAERVVPEKLVGLDEQYEAVYALLAQGVLHKESNSAVLLGARGSGKSMVCERMSFVNGK